MSIQKRRRESVEPQSLTIRTRFASEELLEQILVHGRSAVEEIATVLDPLALGLHVRRQELFIVDRGIGRQRLDTVRQRLVQSILIRLEQGLVVAQLRLRQYLLLFQSSQTTVRNGHYSTRK